MKDDTIKVFTDDKAQFIKNAKDMEIEILQLKEELEEFEAYKSI